MRSFQQKALSEHSGVVSRVVGRLVRTHAPALEGVGNEAGAIIERGSAALTRAGSIVERHEGDVENLMARLPETRRGGERVLETLGSVAEHSARAAPLEDLARAEAVLRKGGRGAPHLHLVILVAPRPSPFISIAFSRALPRRCGCASRATTGLRRASHGA